MLFLCLNDRSGSTTDFCQLKHRKNKRFIFQNPSRPTQRRCTPPTIMYLEKACARCGNTCGAVRRWSVRALLDASQYCEFPSDAAMRVFSNKIKPLAGIAQGRITTNNPSLREPSVFESIHVFVAAHGALQKAAHQSGDLGAVRLQRKVPGIE